MIGPTDLLHPSPAPHFKPFQVFLIEERNKLHIIKLLITGEEEHGFHIPRVHKTLPQNVTFCSVFVIFVMEGECFSRP